MNVDEQKWYVSEITKNNQLYWFSRSLYICAAEYTMVTEEFHPVPIIPAFPVLTSTFFQLNCPINNDHYNHSLKSKSQSNTQLMSMEMFL